MSNSRTKGSMTRNLDIPRPVEDENKNEEEEYDPHGSGTESDGQQELETNADKLQRLQGKLVALKERSEECGNAYKRYIIHTCILCV